MDLKAEKLIQELSEALEEQGYPNVREGFAGPCIKIKEMGESGARLVREFFWHCDTLWRLSRLHDCTIKYLRLNEVHLIGRGKSHIPFGDKSKDAKGDRERSLLTKGSVHGGTRVPILQRRSHR